MEGFVEVAVARPLYQLLTYSVSPKQLESVQPGTWVRVPLGTGKSTGVVLKVHQTGSPGFEDLKKELSRFRIRSISWMGMREFQLPHDVVELCDWAKEYTLSPPGEVFHCAALPLIKSEETLEKKNSKRSQKEEYSSSENKIFDPGSLQFPPSVELSPEQAHAAEAIDQLAHSGGGTLCLEGVTGSGKTEVYIEAAKKALLRGKSVLVLVPEIALTPQLHQRFSERLGISVALWHSAVASGKRALECEQVRSGAVRVVVGARSAVFAPLQDLGLIIVDEEHDPSYKQEDRVRYHARDLAIVRSRLVGATTVLGSATPSLETRQRVQEKKFQHAELHARFRSRPHPEIEIVDLCEEPLVEHLQAPLAQKTLDTIRQELQAGNQVLVYLNRRGFASYLLCTDCNHVRGCPECSISLTVHKRQNRLRCHQCGFEEYLPGTCMSCQGGNLLAVGAGTESIEMELPHLIPEAKILRLDRDQITSATRLNKVLKQFREGEGNLLLGTQMLVKGHDFPGVTLVVVILADALFRWPDFRASERAYQILKQVAGRAGRGEKPGRVLIQAFETEHPVLSVIQGIQPESEFYESERQLREALRYPPYGRLGRFRVEHGNRDEVSKRAHKIAQLMNDWAKKQNKEIEILGPSEAFLEKISGAYRWDLLLKSKEFQVLSQCLQIGKFQCLQQKWSFSVDVDPYGI